MATTTIDKKYIRVGTRVSGEGRTWELDEPQDFDVLDLWQAHEVGGTEVRNLGDNASRTLEAAGWELARGEAERIEFEDALIAGDCAAAARWRAEHSVATGAMTPAEAAQARPAWEAALEAEFVPCAGDD